MHLPLLLLPVTLVQSHSCTSVDTFSCDLWCTVHTHHDHSLTTGNDVCQIVVENATARLHLCFPIRHLQPLLCCRSHCCMLHLHLLLLMLHLHLLIAPLVTAPPCSQIQQPLAFYLLPCTHSQLIAASYVTCCTAPQLLHDSHHESALHCCTTAADPCPLHHNAVDALLLHAVARCSAAPRRQHDSLAALPRSCACTEHHVRCLLLNSCCLPPGSVPCCPCCLAARPVAMLTLSVVSLAWHAVPQRCTRC